MPDFTANGDRRGALAEWVTNPKNPYFARASANRIWFHLFGRGIVDPVDDVRRTNPPAIPALLDALAENFASHNFDRKHFIRTIMNSRVYQLSSKKMPTNAEDVRNFSRHVPRRIGAEALLNAISVATGSPEKFRGFPFGHHAIQIPDGECKHPVLEIFGKPTRATVCECEREADVTLYGAVSMVGSDFLQANHRPLVERDFYGIVPKSSITPPNLKRAYFTSEKRDAIAMEFDQPVKWDDKLITQFTLDGERNKFTSGAVNGNIVTLKLTASSTAKKLTYFDSASWNPINLLRGENGIAALTFCDVLITAK